MADAPILVVDDERHIVQLVRLYLANEGFAVETASTGVEALDKFAMLHPRLVILDLMMPKVDGWEVCRRIRRDGDTPIIMLTARADDIDKVVGLELGADDYVTKPFNPRELVARVKAVLRRFSSTAAPTRDTLALGNLTMDIGRHEVTVDDRLVELRAKEFELLATLLRQPGIVLSRDRLLELVWEYERAGDTRTVDVHVASLRDKMRGADAQIQTVWGVGYKLTLHDPSRVEAGIAERHR
jgi:DNA-binding response OmpR family regulator